MPARALDSDGPVPFAVLPSSHTHTSRTGYKYPRHPSVSSFLSFPCHSPLFNLFYCCFPLAIWQCALLHPPPPNLSLSLSPAATSAFSVRLLYVGIPLLTFMDSLGSRSKERNRLRQLITNSADRTPPLPGNSVLPGTYTHTHTHTPHRFRSLFTPFSLRLCFSQPLAPLPCKSINTEVTPTEPAMHTRSCRGPA